MGTRPDFVCSQRLKLAKHDIAPENRAKTCPKMKGGRAVFSSSLVSGAIFVRFREGFCFQKFDWSTKDIRKRREERRKRKQKDS